MEPLLGDVAEQRLASAPKMKRASAVELVSAIQQLLLKEGHFFHQNPARVAQQMANQPNESPLSRLGRHALLVQGSAWVEHVTKPQQVYEKSDKELGAVWKKCKKDVK